MPVFESVHTLVDFEVLRRCVQKCAVARCVLGGLSSDNCIVWNKKGENRVIRYIADGIFEIDGRVFANSDDGRIKYHWSGADSDVRANSPLVAVYFYHIAYYT